MGPPENVSPSELWLRLTERPQPSEVVPFPAQGRDGRSLGNVRIRVLTGDEKDRASLAAERYMTESLKVRPEHRNGPALIEVMGDAVARELLAMACTGEKPVREATAGSSAVYPRIFQRGEDLAKVLSSAELAALFGSYLLVHEKYGPTERSISSPEERDAWIARLVEGASAHPLARLSLPALHDLIMSLASRSYSLSCILESLHSTSPDILASSLAILGSGTSWSGKLPFVPEGIGSSPSTEIEDAAAPVAPHIVETITTDMAREAARRMRSGEA